MTEAGWTRKLPTKAGFYWYRDRNCGPEPMAVYQPNGPDTDQLAVNEIPLDEFPDESAEWLGPISPTDRQQGRVAGAQLYRDAIISNLKLDELKQQEYTKTDVILALAHADDCIAQAAQYEQSTKEDQ